ncbi:heparinase II/III family protein, partial [Actinotalea sp.]|uniref:heparinase II/III domain-containing protein n=1 Tax=Actinotalea sp. TaxID=1872145 RepID=UPI003564D298
DRAETLTAILDAGPHGGSHGHLDKLGLYLYGDGVAWQPAPGVPPYGSPLRRGYYSRTQAHPTVRVDDQDQQPTTGTVDLLELDPAGGVDRVLAGSGAALDGAHATRELVQTATYLLDVVTVRVTEPSTSGGKHRGDAAPGPGAPTGGPLDRDLTLALRPAVPLEIRATDGGWRTLWHGPEGRELHGVHRATTASALVARPGRGPSDDPAALRTVGDWTVRGSSACFVSVYCVGAARVADVELLTSAQDGTSDGSGSALLGVRIHLTDGTTTEHEVAR